MCSAHDVDAMGATYRMLKACYERDTGADVRSLKGMAVILDATVVRALLDLLETRGVGQTPAPTLRKKTGPKGPRRKTTDNED
jgi:hypothetical protein